VSTHAGLGLPAGLNEVILIERARAKRAWEKNLPEVIDEKSAEHRIKMMEEQDTQEWKWREEEIEEIQRERVLLIEKLVADRAKEDHAHKQQRVEEVYARRHAEWEMKEDEDYQLGLRDLRKLQKQRANVEPIKADRSAVASYVAGSNACVDPLVVWSRRSICSVSRPLPTIYTAQVHGPNIRGLRTGSTRGGARARYRR
jgi:hypothetical protein